ncbi:unnamed protein product [Penicillium palitans]
MSFETDPSQFSREWIDVTNWDDQEVVELLCIEVTTPIGDSTLGKDTYQSERAWSDYEIHSLGNLEKLPREILNMIEPRHSRWVCSIIPAYERARNVGGNIHELQVLSSQLVEKFLPDCKTSHTPVQHDFDIASGHNFGPNRERL